MHQDELIGIADGKFPQQQAVENGKNSGVGADAERQSQNRRDGEDRIRTEPAPGVADLLPQDRHGDMMP